MSSSACGKSGVRFWTVHGLGKAWQSQELLKTPKSGVGRHGRKLGCPKGATIVSCPLGLGVPWFF